MRNHVVDESQHIQISSFLTSILGEQGSTARKSGDIAVVLIFTFSIPFRDFVLKNHDSLRSIFL